MTKVSLPYGSEVIEIDIPKGNLLGVFSPSDIPPVKDIKTEIKRALMYPIGCEPLHRLVKGKQKVVIVADDNTRLTPTHEIIPLLLDEMKKGGVMDEQITIIIALGTHRDMTPEEIIDKFGKEVVNRVKIKNHRFREAESLVDLGTTKNGTPISVNKEVFEADFKIGIGSIVPHHIPGFSGGAKIVQPGICDESTTGATHLLSVNTRRSYLGIVDNPLRDELNYISQKVGLNTIFNTVLDRNGNVVKSFFGDVIKAFLTGVETSKEVYAVYLPEPADIVLASSHPCDIEFWQAHKTLYAADSAVKENGIIIVVTPCPEGVSKTHSDMIEYAGKKPHTVREMLEKGEIKDSVAAALAIAWGQIRERERIFLVSGGISAEDIKKLKFTPFDTVTEALKQALEIKGKDAKIAVLTHAPDMLPIIGKQLD